MKAEVEGDEKVQINNELEAAVKVPEEDEEPNNDPSATDLAVGQLKVNADGTVVQEDKVQLWEPGYRERYYRQKFGVEPSDAEFRKAYVPVLDQFQLRTQRKQVDQELR
jgi:5'-3' exonuclease